MRTIWILATVALVAPSLAAAGAGTEYASASETCGLLHFTPIAPPNACPHVQQTGTAVGTTCADTPNGSVCEVVVHVASTAQGLLLTPRELTAEIVVLDGNETATRICSLTANGASLGCEGEAAMQLRMNVDGCRDFRVRSGLRDLGVENAYLFHLQTDYMLQVCRHGADADVTRN